MKRIRFAKVRITSPAGKTGLDHLSDIQDRIKREHDKAIAHYDLDLVVAAGTDLVNRKVWNTKDPEDRWILNRRAALLRRHTLLSK